MSLLDQPFEVDLVYTWVDGSDPEFQRTKRKYQQQEQPKSKYSTETNRFRDLDELKYSIRTVLKFAPFIRKIFLVTNGQRPTWLKNLNPTTVPPIELITHRQIFPEPQANYLPTFNSIAIEANLHRIPGLSEYFIYFNDDVFFGRPVTKRNFLTPEGKTKIYLRADNFVPKRNPNYSLTSYYFKDGLYHTHCYLNRHSKKRKPRKTHQHVGIMLRKSVLEQIEEQLKQTGDWSNCLTRFRQNRNLKLISLLYPYYSLDHSLAVNDSKVKCLKVSEQHARQFPAILQRRYHMFCLNTITAKTPELKKFYHKLVPEPSPYEEN